MLYDLRGPLSASVRCFMVLEYRDTAGHKNRYTGLQMAFTAVLCFGISPALLDADAKMTPAGRRTAHKRRETAGEYRDMGKEKPPQGSPGRAVVVFKIFSPSPRSPSREAAE